MKNRQIINEFEQSEFNHSKEKAVLTAKQHYPFRILIIVAASLFTVEFLMMFIIEILPPLPYLAITIIDSSLLTVLVFPVIYIFLFNPLLNHIKERKTAEDELQIFFSVVPDLLVTVSTDGYFKKASNAWQTVLGYSEQELLTTPFLDLIHPDDRETAKKELGRLVAAEMAHQFVIRFLHKDGTYRWLEWEATPVLNNTLYAAARDITERKKAEAELIKAYEELEKMQVASLNIMADLDRRTTELSVTLKEKEVLLNSVERINKELNDFAYIVSHDLKAPLRAISQLADWLAEDYTEVLDDAGKEKLKVLRNRAVRMHNMIEGILQFSRVGRMEGRPQVVDTDKVVRQVIDSLALPQNIRITIHDSLPPAVIDPLHINQIFQNLVSNAIKYMDKPEGVIEVGCRDADNFHEFFVKDNGPGIEERHFERIFQIFQTLTPRDEYESTGIGLSIVKKIIEQNGGRIWVESEVGKGSTFRFTIPKKGVV